MTTSSGPDRHPGRLLQCLAKDSTPLSDYIFSKSLYTSELPREWTQSNVAPIFMKGSTLQAVYNRHVPLTCITCMLYKHSICNHISAHHEDHTFFTNLQHDFKSGKLN